MYQIMGCRQVARHRTLTATFRRFESYHPSHLITFKDFLFGFIKNIDIKLHGRYNNKCAWTQNMRVSYIGNTLAFQASKVGSIPTTRSIYALLAQLVEHLTLNQGALGSSPRWRTRKL